jgi:acyl carrier protein
VHCAAVLDDAALPQQTSERIANVFAPKVIGALLLDKLTRADPLDLFILFSSMASVFGSRGQANYAAANAVLDLLAEDRRRRGLCALSINWGAWAEVGVAAERGLPERLAASGLGAMTPAQGISVLERLLQADAAQVIAAPMDWQRFNEQMGPGWTQELLADILASVGDVSRPSEQYAAPVPGLPAEFASAASPRRRQLVATFVRDTTLRTLGIDALKQVEPATPLTELGLDSLLAVELRNTLGTGLAKKLPVSLLFDYPTINALITYLLDEVMVAELAGPGETIGDPATAQSDRDTDPLGLIEELTDEDVDRLLSARERVSV